MEHVEPTIVHVLPVNDIDEHCGSGTVCKCGPKVEKIDGCYGVVVIHNSFDGREFLEQGLDHAFDKGLN